MLDSMLDFAHAAKPYNRRTLSWFIESPRMRFVEDLLCGLRDPKNMDNVDWNNNPLFKRFKPYIQEQQDEMDRFLEKISYNIDAENTLRVVTQYRQPEKVSRLRYEIINQCMLNLNPD